MEAQFRVDVEIDVEYEVGSPPDDSVDPYMIVNPEIVDYTSIWMTREGPSGGLVTSAMNALYPPFTNANRRTIFFILSYGTPTITWNSQAFTAGGIWLTTDPSWTNPIVISSNAEGHWFSCEGELESDYRIWKKGKEENIAL